MARTRLKAAAASLSCTMICLGTQTVWACPACAARESGGRATFALIGLMVGVPYVIAVVAIRVVRALDREQP